MLLGQGEAVLASDQSRRLLEFCRPRTFAFAAVATAAILTLWPGREALAQAGYVVRPIGDRVRIDMQATGSGQVDLNLPLRVKRVEFVGLDETDDQVARNANPPPRTAADLFRMAAELEAAYSKMGYAFPRAVVPPQTIEMGGTAQVILVHLLVEALDLEALPPSLRDHVQRRLAPLIGRAQLRSSELARILGVLQVESGVALNVEPAPGSSAERIRLVVSGPKRAVAGEVSGVMFGSRPYRQLMSSAVVSAISPLGFGDRITLAGTVGRRSEDPNVTGPVWATAGAIQLPLNDTGLHAELLGSVARELRERGRYELGQDYRYEKLGFRFGYPVFLRGGSEILLIKVGPDIIHEDLLSRFHSSTWPIGAHQTFTTEVVRAGATWFSSYAGGIRAQLGAELTIGRAATETTFGPDPIYVSEARRGRAITKLDTRMQLDLPLVAGIVATFSARGQYSFNGRLTPAEQLQLLPTEVSLPINPETNQGDSGAIGRLELARPFGAAFLAPAATITPYGFAAGGFVWEKGHLDVRSQTVTGFKYGAGFRAQVPDLLAGTISEFGLEVFRQESNGSVPDHTGLTLRLTARF